MTPHKTVARFIVLLSICLLGRVGSVYADEITFVADEWPPYNGVPNSTEEGYFLDIIRSIFEAEGHRVNYIVRPWKRAIREVNTGIYDALLGPFKTEAPGFVFPDQEIGYTALSFFTRKDSAWTFKELDSLMTVRLGIIQDYDYRPWLQEFRRKYPDKFIIVSGEDATIRNLHMLIRGRIDVIPSNENTFLYQAKREGFLDQVRLAGRDTIGEGKKLYIAFSPSKPKSDTYAKMLSEGIQELRASDRLDAILAKYGLVDWKKGD